MANPQCEHGYTKIANELLLNVAKRITNSTWIRILLLTMRLTYGWHRKETESNYSSYATQLNMTKEGIKNSLVDLQQQGIIIFVPLTAGKFLISINKDYDQWKV